jgi:hypothetical protein
MPGAQMANNYACREELEDWLRLVGAGRMVIIYDNDQKDEPSFAPLQS